LQSDLLNDTEHNYQPINIRWELQYRGNSHRRQHDQNHKLYSKRYSLSFARRGNTDDHSERRQFFKLSISNYRYGDLWSLDLLYDRRFGSNSVVIPVRWCDNAYQQRHGQG
jgi:hypothetical protein